MSDGRAVATSGVSPVLSEAEAQAVRRGVPDPGIPLPRVAVPTVALFVASLAVWVLATWLAATHASPWLTIPLHALVTFTMFTVLHEATHHAAGRLTWVNELLGRLSLPFVACYGSFGMVRYIHIEHHRNTNEDIRTDPDAWTSHGPAFQLPLRWLTIDFWYAAFWLSRIRRRPRREVVETLVLVAGSAAGLVVAIASGHLWELAVLYLVPQRIGLFVLAWWFDWLPHHDLPYTAKQDRFRSTRVRVGLEWLLTPMMLYQNYHLVHHLHPAIPFYRYITAWQRNQDVYLAHEVPIATAWGRELTASEYRAWRRLTSSFYAEDAVEPAAAARRGRFHRLTVSDVRRLTPDAVSISFDIPRHLREEYRFKPGQHLTLRAEIDGREVRRTYSICTAATSDLVRIAVKRVPGGVFSTHLCERVGVGDVLEVMPPAGRFTLVPAEGNAKHYVGIAAGSGITPVISMLSTALLVEDGSRFTLLYGNRTAESIMFRDELEMLVRQFEGRLRVVHFLSGDEARHTPSTGFEEVVPGRIDPEKLTSLLRGRLAPDKVDDWFLCGPQDLVDQTRELLLAHGVAAEKVHVELFHTVSRTRAIGRTSAITATIDGRRASVTSEGTESVLEAVLRSGADAPYACMGGACGTCRAKVLRGTVDMELNYALSEAEVHAGYVLTCQSRPTSERLDVDYDA
ncbi:Electron transfer protein FdxB [Carbonactinospora thermoautotrophica]|uniref:Electron transfer protein FdxB n=1 Tax=Carbonactinospora thermoautotrophica TaxID=1469144 RepID=A0A132MNA3_9ACTN|nr:fatty acid desaturase [Carbonactinospora thermoautotrophica]KWW99344.1 Electron transfer protein FdxB [Carbonactinospora thermoautotrophica]